MRRSWNGKRRNRRFQWLGCAVAIGVALVSSGCRRETQTTASSIYGQIENEFVLGNLPTALEHSNEALKRFEVGSAYWAATFRLESAKILIWQGNNRDAFTLLQQTLPENSHTELAVRRKVLLSIAQARLGHLDQAEVVVLESAHECLPNLSLCAEVSGARGTINMERQDFDEADRQFQASLSNARLSNDHFLQTQALLNLGRVAMIEEHYEDALARFRETSALAKSLDAKLLLEKVTGNLGWIYYKTGDFPRALDSYREAEKQATELGVPKDQVLWLNNVGQSEFRLRDFDAARQSYERSLRLAQSIQDQNEILVLHEELAYLLLHLNDLNAAEEHIREAIRLAALRKNNRTQLNPLLLQALLLDARGDKQSATKTLLDLDKRGAELPVVKWDAENNLARIYAEIDRQADADRWFRRSIDTFQHSRASLSSVDSALPFLSNGAELYETYSEYLIDQHKTGEALSVIDQSRAESLEDGLHLTRSGPKGRSTALNAKSIAARLQAIILVYSLRPKTSYLWAITPTSQQFYRLAGSETILPLIQLHTKMILASKDLLSQPTAPGQALYNELVRPAQSLIKKDGRVFIVGDEALSGLNFETLQTLGDDSHYWIEDVTVTNAKSLQLLSVKQLDRSKYEDRRILLMGDPVYRKDDYPALPNASSEIKNIASHFSSDHRVVLTGEQASPEAYQLSDAGQFSYIHFVAHGTANMTVPLDSSVVLSSNHDNATVYKLYARDILKQNLHADLVTVSACNGSGVRNYSGEGLVGLAWAFLRAGSHHVIGAMWEVSDVSTPLLMDHLYSELARGSQPDTSLRSAKLSLIHSNGVFRKPLYWAPFLLYSGA